MTETRTITEVHESIADRIRAQAVAAHAQYPQFAGAWDGWTLMRITRPVRTKLGVAFVADELVLVSPGTRSERVCPRGRAGYGPLVEYSTAYSVSNKCNTTVRTSYLRSV
jgi:hypothetical protein